MTTDLAIPAEYKIVFDQLQQSLDAVEGEVINITPSAQLSEEIEALRLIVEQVELAESREHSITVG